MWQVQMICCGFNAGIKEFASYEEAANFRESWTSGPGVALHGYSACLSESGHQRAIVIKKNANN